MDGINLPNTQPERCTLSKWAEQSHLARMVYDFPYTDIVYDATYSLDHNLSINYAKIVEWKTKVNAVNQVLAKWLRKCANNGIPQRRHNLDPECPSFLFV